MKQGIIIFGPAGSGKTTLGRMVAEQLGILFVDIDDYLWRNDTEIPFSVMYSRSEKINGLMDSIALTDRFVMAGSMDSFHEYFDPFFILAVHLTAPADIRVTRVHQREYEEFGSRVLSGGDMYESHQRFLDDAASYDFGGGSTSMDLHKKWADSLQCPILRLDGSDNLGNNSRIIAEKYGALCAV